MTRTTLLLTTCAALLGTLIPGHAQAAPPPTRPLPTLLPVDHEHPDKVLLREQMATHPEIPPLSFWLAVAQCETRQEWNRGHDWGKNPKSWVSGGLGIANTAWKNYGGKRFARKAAFASMWAQIIVANRIAFVGHQTQGYLTWEDREAGRRFFRPPSRVAKWGGVCRHQWVKENQ